MLANHKGLLPDVVVDGEFVAANLKTLVICDVRWYLDGRSARAAYEDAHLPSAVFVDLDHDLSDRPGGERGRHPLPTPEDFAQRLGALGIDENEVVVAYDDSGGGTAGRLVWMLRSIGQPAALLDGGIKAWKGTLEKGDGSRRAVVRRSVAPWPSSLQVSFQEVEQLSANQLLFDARAAERYRGENESADPKAGHIPEAHNLPWNSLLDSRTGTFLAPDALRERLFAAGIEDGKDVVASCGSGVSACALLVAIEHAGLGSGRLFVASWSGWSASSRPIATGA